MKLAELDVYNVLRSILDVYHLTPNLVRDLWDGTISALRGNLDRTVQKLSVKSVYDEVVSENTDFMKESLEAYATIATNSQVFLDSPFGFHQFYVHTWDYLNLPEA